MTTLFLIFAVVSSALIYYATLRYLRTHPQIRPSTLQGMMLAAFLIMAVICVWIGYNLRGVLAP